MAWLASFRNLGKVTISLLISQTRRLHNTGKMTHVEELYRNTTNDDIYKHTSSTGMLLFDETIGGVAKLNDGNEIPMVGLGCWQIQGQETMDICVRSALQCGYRLFDTAAMYENEGELGNSLEKYLPEFNLQRRDIFITTKFSTIDQDPEDKCREQIQTSLFKLKTNYLDLVLVHYPRDRDTGKDRDHETNYNSRRAVWGILEMFKVEGKIRSIGVANYTNYHLTEMRHYAQIPPAVNQIEFHPYLTQNLIRLQCKEQNIFVQGFSNLGYGNSDLYNESALLSIAQGYAVSPQVILLAFARACGLGIMPKSVHPNRIYSNLHEVCKIQLTEKEIETLLDLDQNLAFCSPCTPWRVM